MPLIRNDWWHFYTQFKKNAALLRAAFLMATRA